MYIRFFISLAALIFFTCKSNQKVIKNHFKVDGNSLILQLNQDGKDSIVLLPTSESLIQKTLQQIALETPGIRTIFSFAGKAFAVSFAIIRKDESVVFLQSANESYRRINIAALDDAQVYDIYLNHNKSQLYLTYKSTNGIGVNVCTLQTSKCQLLTQKDGLKVNFVHQVAEDLHNNIWFCYDPSEEIGVSKLSADKKWQHFDSSNSELAEDAVYYMKFEKLQGGLPFDNLWFVTRSGLTRLQQQENSEKWKLYGKKKSFGSTMARLVGIEEWFSKNAILDIKQIAIAKNYLIINNGNKIYQLKEDDIINFTPEGLKGLEEAIIGKIALVQGKVYIPVFKKLSGHRELTSLQQLDLTTRQWRSLPIISLANAPIKKITFASKEPLIMTIHLRYGSSMLVKYQSGKLEKLSY